jgi:hygromycin-B 7''-O-kinase
LRSLGALTAQVQTLTGPGLQELTRLALAWPEFLAQQRQHCLARQQRTGLPPHLLQQVEPFLPAESVAELSAGPWVMLTGEYTPMNLLVQKERLSGMFDFGDGLVGPREYDWLGPLCFLAAGNADRCLAYLSACGAVLDDALRLRLMRLLLLHRYSHLQAQLALPGWQQQPDFLSLARALWP